MAWIAMYLLPPDIELLNNWLNQESEIAFLVTDGPGKWIAQNARTISRDIGTQVAMREYSFLLPDYAEYNLWHVPSGPLPLLTQGLTESLIANPWQGWTELRGGQNPRIPYFGAGHPGAIHLELKLYPGEEIPMSNFGWIGNHYRISGNAADKSTEAFWKKLRSAVKKMATQIPRANQAGGKNEIFAFPTAYEAIQNGRPCAINP